MKFVSGFSAAAALAAACGSTLAANPWADSVVNYVQGTSANPDFVAATAALGSPERVTGEDSPFGSFPGSITPFAGAFGFGEFVSIGAGGSLTVRFDEPVVDDALNPFGIDLLIFGNSFFTTSDFVTPRTTGISSDGGIIEVSADGATWFAASGAADGLFPTLGYLDETSPFGGPAGSLPTDFTRPVDPAFAWQNKTLSELIAGYDGSGGGHGVDIGALGLTQISFVRISVPLGSASDVEIDAFSDVTAVPAPGPVVLLIASACAAGRLRRRR